MSKASLKCAVHQCIGNAETTYVRNDKTMWLCNKCYLDFVQRPLMELKERCAILIGGAALHIGNPTGVGDDVETSKQYKRRLHV